MNKLKNASNCVRIHYWNAWLFVPELEEAHSWILRNMNARHLSCYLAYPFWITNAANNNWKR